MEQNHTEREVIPYTEQKLSEQLDFACEQLYPTNGFKLELQGIAPTVLVRKELEAYTGVNLDAKTGATIVLGYDDIKSELSLTSLRHPLDNQSSASLVIQKTTNNEDGLEYIAFLDISGREFSASSSKKDEPLTAEDIAHILEGYGVSDIPHPTHEIYRLWRANLLSNCQKGWKLSEEVEMFVDMQEHKTETIKVNIDEQYQEEGITSRTKQISRVLSINDDSGATGQQFESSIIQVDNDYGRTVHLQNNLMQKEFHPFVAGDPGVVLKSTSENVTLDLDSFNAYKGLIEDATSHLQQTKEI